MNVRTLSVPNDFRFGSPSPLKRTVGCLLSAAVILAGLPVSASENVPHAPYAMWADLPTEGQFVVGLIYEESESYHIWANGHSQQYNVTVNAHGEKYGIDINQGYFRLQYGIAEQWAADLSFGYTSEGWRSFSPGNSVQKTDGLMDSALGVRYQIFNEATASNKWVPTLTFRAGAILPGTFNQYFVYSPGLRSAAIEPELLVRKHFGWPGLGAYGDFLYRWNKTSANDQYLASVGLFQQIKGWEIDFGYYHLGTVSGGDVVYNPSDPSAIVYPRAPRENYDAIMAGFSYTTSKQKIRYGFNSRLVLDGNNSDQKFWVGASVDIPFGGHKDAPREEAEKH